MLNQKGKLEMVRETNCFCVFVSFPEKRILSFDETLKLNFSKHQVSCCKIKHKQFMMSSSSTPQLSGANYLEQLNTIAAVANHMQNLALDLRNNYFQQTESSLPVKQTIKTSSNNNKQSKNATSVMECTVLEDDGAKENTLKQISEMLENDAKVAEQDLEDLKQSLSNDLQISLANQTTFAVSSKPQHDSEEEKGPNGDDTIPEDQDFST
jgi:hypothetical protein